jgi:hypothetical protein
VDEGFKLREFWAVAFSKEVVDSDDFVVNVNCKLIAIY